MYYLYTILLVNKIFLIVQSKNEIGLINNLPKYDKLIDIVESIDDLTTLKIIKSVIEKYHINTNIIYGIYDDNIFTECKKEDIVKENINCSLENLNLETLDDNQIELKIKELQNIRQSILEYEEIIANTNLELLHKYGIDNFLSDYDKYLEYINSRNINININPYKITDDQIR